MEYGYLCIILHYEYLNIWVTLCMPVDLDESLCIPVYILVFMCKPVSLDEARFCVSLCILCITVYLCAILYPWMRTDSVDLISSCYSIPEYHCVSLCIQVYICVSLCVSVYPSVSQCISIYLCIPVCLNVSIFPCVSLCIPVSLCNPVSLDEDGFCWSN